MRGGREPLRRGGGVERDHGARMSGATAWREIEATALKIFADRRPNEPAALRYLVHEQRPGKPLAPPEGPSASVAAHSPRRISTERLPSRWLLTRRRATPRVSVPAATVHVMAQLQNKQGLCRSTGGRIYTPKFSLQGHQIRERAVKRAPINGPLSLLQTGRYASRRTGREGAPVRVARAIKSRAHRECRPAAQARGRTNLQRLARDARARSGAKRAAAEARCALPSTRQRRCVWPVEVRMRGRCSRPRRHIDPALGLAEEASSHPRSLGDHPSTSSCLQLACCGVTQSSVARNEIRCACGRTRHP
jgi:hypothetical protein